MKFSPTSNNVFVTRTRREATKSGRLFIPEVAAVDENQCMVIAIGPKVEDQTIKVGTVVLVEKYDGRKIKVDGLECIVMPEAEILGTYNAPTPQEANHGQEEEEQEVLDA